MVQESEKLKKALEEGRRLQAHLLPHTNKVSQQTDNNVCELQNDSCFTLPSKCPTKISFVVHPKEKCTGKGILENIFQPCQLLTHYKITQLLLPWIFTEQISAQHRANCFTFFIHLFSPQTHKLAITVEETEENNSS